MKSPAHQPPTPEQAASHVQAAPLALAIGRLATGDARGALRAASEACHAAPDDASAHYVYGQAWSALGDEASAERAFAAAVQLRPRWADAWVNYGVARYRQGAIADAKVAMSHALAAAPDHAAAASNLAAFLRVSGEPEAAEVILRRLATGGRVNTGATLNRAADLLNEERAVEALALLDAAPLPDDLHALRPWHLQRALALLQLGRAADARSALAAFDALGPVPPALAPLRHWRDVLLAQREGDELAAERAAAAMAGTLDAMGPGATPEHRIMGHYDLAKFHSGLGHHAQAFAHWTAGHRLLAPSQPFSRAAHRALVDTAIATFDGARFAHGPRAQNRDARPVFIVGMPRSGTTLCEQILAAHADVHGAGERTALADAFAKLGGATDSPEAARRVAALPVATLDSEAATYLADLAALAPGKARVVDKMPGNYLHLGLVGLMLPGARIIHCVRDPRDIGLSIFTFRFHGSHGYAHDLGDLGWTIRQHERLMNHWKAALPNPVLTVALADWVEDFDGTLARVLAHLDLPHDPACLRFHEREDRVRTVSRAQVRQPINARGLGRWRAYEAELAPLIAALAPAAA